MSRKGTPADLPASVRARLTNVSRKEGVEFQRILSDFAIERFLYRLGISEHAERFILKGAMLFRVWSSKRHRATWDLDLLGRGANEIDDVVVVVREVCSIPVNDGIEFDLDSVEAEDILAAEEYAGVRVHLVANLAGARIPMQVDVGFGDAVTPNPHREAYPVLLDFAAPQILVYPRETVVAEKLEAMITLGVTNSRMKDFFDVHTLASTFMFDGAVLADAVRNTFERRGTPIPDERPLVLTREFLGAPERQMQWRAFLRRGRLEGPVETGELVDALWRFMGPVLRAARGDGAFTATWPAGGPWLQEGGA